MSDQPEPVLDGFVSVERTYDVVTTMARDYANIQINGTPFVQITRVDEAWRYTQGRVTATYPDAIEAMDAGLDALRAFLKARLPCTVTSQIVRLGGAALGGATSEIEN